MDNDTDCEILPHSVLKKALATKGVVGSISLVAVIASLVLFFLFFRRYKQGKDYLSEIGATERLVLYIAFGAIFRSLVVILQTTAVDYNRNDPVQVDLCQATGFLDQWSVWIVMLAVQMILIHLLLQLTIEVKMSMKRPLEAFYIVFPVVFPLVFSWVPFTKDLYGPAGAWCWIRGDRGCDEFIHEFLQQNAYLFGPMLFLQIIDTLFITVVYPVLMLKKVQRKQDRIDLLKQHGALLLALSLSIIISFISLINRAVIAGTSNRKSDTAIWIVHAVGSSSWGILAAIVILLYLLGLSYQQPGETYEEKSLNKVNTQSMQTSVAISDSEV